MRHYSEIPKKLSRIDLLVKPAAIANRRKLYKMVNLAYWLGFELPKINDLKVNPTKLIKDELINMINNRLLLIINRPRLLK